MATLAVTYAAGTSAGAQIRKLAQRLQEAAAVVPDNTPTGASVVLTLDNAPSSGTVSIAITGPYASGTFIV